MVYNWVQPLLEAAESDVDAVSLPASAVGMTMSWGSAAFSPTSSIDELAATARKLAATSRAMLSLQALEAVKACMMVTWLRTSELMLNRKMSLCSVQSRKEWKELCPGQGRVAERSWSVDGNVCCLMVRNTIHECHDSVRKLQLDILLM